jgi:transcriptional regulator with XRE-family HTH domain
MDYLRIGRSLRALRQRRGMTQRELAGAAGVSQSLISLMERGHLDSIALRTIRSVFAVLDTRTELAVSWRGGALDRLLDEAHSSIVSQRASALRAARWVVVLEATYSVYGERGSIDLFAAMPVNRAVLVEEVKSDLTSLEELGRKTDEKTRLARTRLCRERFGFDPLAIGRILVLPDTDAARRKVARLASVLDVLFPSRGRAVRAWLRNPVGDLSGILFVANSNRRAATGDQRGRQRVRRSRTETAERGNGLVGARVPANPSLRPRRLVSAPESGRTRS